MQTEKVACFSRNPPFWGVTKWLMGRTCSRKIPTMISIKYALEYNDLKNNEGGLCILAQVKSPF